MSGVRRRGRQARTQLCVVTTARGANPAPAPAPAAYLCGAAPCAPGFHEL